MVYDPVTSAFVFPGQGSQQVGMGQDLATDYPMAAQTFHEADAILGYGLSELCFHGPDEQLNITRYTQPALFVAGVAVWRALGQIGIPQPAMMAGHSLGEFTALVAAGALGFEDGLRLVQRRADLMDTAGASAPGAVAAILGLDVPDVQALCDEADALVVVANDNCPGQVVVSGTQAGIDAVLQRASAAGAKRALQLPVSVAVHSPLMQDAAEAFAADVQHTPLKDPQVPIVGNVTAQALTTAEALRDELTRQMTASVLWRDSIQTMLAAGITTYWELGPGEVLTGLVKRIDRKTTRRAIGTSAQIADLAAS